MTPRRIVRRERSPERAWRLSVRASRRESRRSPSRTKRDPERIKPLLQPNVDIIKATAMRHYAGIAEDLLHHRGRHASIRCVLKCGQRKGYKVSNICEQVKPDNDEQPMINARGRLRPGSSTSPPVNVTLSHADCEKSGPAIALPRTTANASTPNAAAAGCAVSSDQPFAACSRGPPKKARRRDSSQRPNR